jgi:hypothetical protein
MNRLAIDKSCPNCWYVCLVNMGSFAEERGTGFSFDVARLSEPTVVLRAIFLLSVTARALKTAHHPVPNLSSSRTCSALSCFQLVSEEHLNYCYRVPRIVAGTLSLLTWSYRYSVWHPDCGAQGNRVQTTLTSPLRYVIILRPDCEYSWVDVFWTDITDEIAAGNRCFRGSNKMLGTRYLSKNIKIRTYKTIIRPVILYGSETWTITGKMASILMTWERNILRKIYGPKSEHTWHA